MSWPPFSFTRFICWFYLSVLLRFYFFHLCRMKFFGSSSLVQYICIVPQMNKALPVTMYLKDLGNLCNNFYVFITFAVWCLTQPVSSCSRRICLGVHAVLRSVHCSSLVTLACAYAIAGCHKQVVAGDFALQGELKRKPGASNGVHSGITAAIHASSYSCMLVARIQFCSCFSFSWVLEDSVSS